MTRKKMLVADLLCGAGGSSTGASRALKRLGLELDLVCVNHWPTAIETHTRNHPEARHFVQDIATVRPHLLVPEGYLDLLMASPTCTHHSVARGGKPTSDQQRSDPWHIITWLTELRVKRIIIENVWEFTGWGPVDPRNGKPIKSRKGEYFRAWIDTLRRLGFDPEWRKLNAADFGDATTRQRFILMARSDDKTVSWPVPTHRKREAGRLELFPTMLPWKPARDIIDWSIKGRSIYGRKKDLAPKTMLRILAGAEKHGWPSPYIVTLRQHMAARGIDLPLPTIAANGGHIGLATPVLLSQHNSGTPRSADEPLPTITTGGAAAGEHPGCARPILVTVAHGNDEGDRTANSRRSHSVDEPLGTVSAGGIPFALAEPFVLSQGAGGAPRGANEPIPTVPGGGAHALIAPYYGSGSGETCKSTDEPLDTVTAKERFGMVVPVTHSQGGNGARSTAEPIPTLTTAKGGEFAVVMPVTHAGAGNRALDADVDPLPTVTGANRGELAFITAQHGERDGQAPRVHDIADPAPTIAATGHVDLVQGAYKIVDIDVRDGSGNAYESRVDIEWDILFRMLEPHELAAAMGFTSDEVEYEFAGTKTEQIKQIGNAVSVAKMTACVGALMADAAPKASSLPAVESEAA